MMPSESELDGIRADLQAALFDTTCNILERTVANTGQGGTRESWGTASGGTAIPCRIEAFASKGASSFRGNEILTGGRIMDFSQWVVTMPYDTVVDVENRVEVNGNTYNIIVCDNGKSWDVDTRLIVEKI